MTGPECWHPSDADVDGDTEWCDDCGEPLDRDDDTDRLYEAREWSHLR